MALPKPEQGEKILFWKNYPIAGPGKAATVTMDGQNAQSVMVVTRSGPAYFDCVHYLHDEKLPSNTDWWTTGVWDFHPETTKVQQLTEEIRLLREEVLVLSIRLQEIRDTEPAKSPKKPSERSPEQVEADRARMAAMRAKRKQKV